MTLTPILNATLGSQIHVFGALFAFVVGAVQFALPKGTKLHRWIGWGWAISILLTLITFNLNMFNFLNIHWIVSAFFWVLIISSLSYAIQSIRRRNDIEDHRKGMAYTYVIALLGFVILTMHPDYIMNHVVFGK